MRQIYNSFLFRQNKILVTLHPIQQNKDKIMSNKVNNYDLAWYAKGDWKEGLQAQPDETVNKEEFIRQYAANPELWRKAFRFLADPEFPHLAGGKYEIDGENLFVNINEYITKNEEDAKCEAHIKYADKWFRIHRRLFWQTAV
jgi:hypothetical protein